MDDYEVLTEARRALRRHSRKLTTSAAEGTVDAFAAGRTADAADAADAALFHALNMLAAYMGDENAAAQIALDHEQREAEQRAWAAA